MSEDQETIAIALHIAGRQGERAPIYIAEQLGAVASRRDAAGVARWQTIAAAFDDLQRRTRQ